jgi:hypothetical protein
LAVDEQQLRAVSLNHVVHDGQAQAAALSLALRAALKALKHTLAVFGRNARAVVFNL